MIVVDANLLLYAYTASSEHHKVAKAWLESMLSGRETVAIPWSSIHAFLRIATHPSLFENPLSMEEAATIVRTWLGQPQVLVIAPGPRYEETFLALLHDGQARGNLVMDAHLAALTIEQAATLHSTDRDFLRFPGLRVVNPLDGA
ncbi:MAG: TA system VapC family ribonuclease toxin [Acidobacteriota bacterium]